MTSATDPDTPSTERSSSRGAPRPMSWLRCPSGKTSASRTRTTPPAVVNVVSSTSVPSTYACSASNSALGRIDQWPASGSSTRANTAGPSKRGRQSQSTEPSRETRADVLQSDSRP
jgi:hypothetical protein